MALIPYIRQSRAKERTISLDEQRRTIESWATARGETLAPEVVEQGVSGSKPWRERELGRAMERVEAGDAQGIVVAFQDRLSRENGLATAEVWDTLERAGARLVCAAEGLDTATGDHELTFSIKAAIARDQWKRHAANWKSARRNAVERGIHGGPFPPAGYDRDPATKLLVPNDDAPAIREAFRRRAAGHSWSKVAAFLTQSGVVTSRGATSWSLKAAEKLTTNRVYLGEARSGDNVKLDAHPAIVSPAEFRAVQQTRVTRAATNRNNDGRLLTGLLHCQSCGHRLVTDWTVRDGKRYYFYRCRNQGACSQPVSIGANKVEAHVESVVGAWIATASVDVTERTGKLDKLSDAVSDAEHALSEWIASDTGVSPAIFAARATKLEDAVNEATREYQAFAQSWTGTDLPTVTSAEAWSALSVVQRREVIEGLTKIGDIPTLVVKPKRDRRGGVVRDRLTTWATDEREAVAA